MSYSWLTFTQAKTALANRLSDPNKIFWVDSELGEYLKESLRTFNAIAQFHRDQVTFPTKVGFSFYDLTSANNIGSITAGTGSGASNPPALVGYSLLDRDLINDIQYHLIETITTNWAGGWTGTDQFTMDDVTRAIERRRNMFLLITGLALTHSQVSYAAPPDGRVSLSDSIIDVRRISWLDSLSVYTPLWRMDEWDASAFNVGWETAVAGIPDAYSFYMPPKVGLQIIPNSSDIATLDLVTINNPGDLDETTGVLLNTPDDWAWVVKWGALADLLSKEGQAYDPARAQYCQQRWDEGVKYAMMGATINQSYINNIVVQPMSLTDFDAYNYSWQNTTSAQPTDIAIAGRNLIALTPTPDSTSYTIKLDVLRNAPMPSSGSDFIQIGREQWDIILDYATHLAMFKMQGAEFEDTFPLMNRFMQIALDNNERLRAEAKNYNIMRELSSKQDEDKPRRDVDEVAA